MFPLICVWINGWVNNREAGDLRRHRGHYDVNVMSWQDASVIAMAGMWLAPLMHYLIHFHHQSIDRPLSYVFSQAVPWVQYTPRNMHTVFALLCFVVVVHWLIFPYPWGLLHWHCSNLTIAPVPAKQTWWIWINTSCEFIMNDYITTKKQSTTKPCAYFLGYTVDRSVYCQVASMELPSWKVSMKASLFCSTLLK